MKETGSSNYRCSNEHRTSFLVELREIRLPGAEQSGERWAWLQVWTCEYELMCHVGMQAFAHLGHAQEILLQWADSQAKVGQAASSVASGATAAAEEAAYDSKLNSRLQVKHSCSTSTADTEQQAALSLHPLAGSMHACLQIAPFPSSTSSIWSGFSHCMKQPCPAGIMSIRLGSRPARPCHGAGTHMSHTCRHIRSLPPPSTSCRVALSSTAGRQICLFCCFPSHSSL